MEQFRFVVVVEQMQMQWKSAHFKMILYCIFCGNYIVCNNENRSNRTFARWCADCAISHFKPRVKKTIKWINQVCRGKWDFWRFKK